MNAGCKGVGTGLVRGLSDGLNSRLVRILEFPSGKDSGISTGLVGFKPTFSITSA